MKTVAVEICAPDSIPVTAWNELIAHAPGNVFLTPAALRAAQATGFSDVVVLLAWNGAAEHRRLIGLWALQKRRLAWFAPAYLAAPPYNYAFLSSPVVEPGWADDVMPAFFTAIARAPHLPKLLALKDLDADTPIAVATKAALIAGGSSNLELLSHARPFVSKQVGMKSSGSTRKKLRQDWNRLSRLGEVTVVNAPAPNDVAAAFEEFLLLEAESWKGTRGTALLSNAQDAAFTRRLVHDLAAVGSASVVQLMVDGKTIAAQVVLSCGRTAYTWKTAYDGAYAKYSPGALLVDRVVELMFARDDIEEIESCSPDGGFMSHLWAERRQSVDLLVDVHQRHSLSFAVAVLGGRGYETLRSLRNRLRAAIAGRRTPNNPPPVVPA